MAHYVRIDRLPDLKNKKVLFDTNIWIYIFCEIGEYNKFFVHTYSKAFYILLRSENTIYTDLTILSEFINRYLKIACSNYLKRENLSSINYKRDYRITEDYKEAWATVCDIVRQKILSNSHIVNTNYDQTSMANLLQEDQFGTDFNDNHIVNLCQVEDMFLMTNDADFKHSNLNVITENNAYWRS